MSDKIEWCIACLKNDYKWWVEKLSNDAHIDGDYAGIIDPHQFEHLIELTSPLQNYGLRNDLIENAFLKFRIVAALSNNEIKLEFTNSKVFDAEEPLFLFPNGAADNEGPYMELIDHLIRLRVKLLNDLIDFKVPLDSEEIEEAIKEKYQEKYVEGNNVHVFDEMVDILEYTPEGYDLGDKGEYTDTDEPEFEEDFLDDKEEFNDEDGAWNEELQKLEVLES